MSEKLRLFLPRLEAANKRLNDDNLNLEEVDEDEEYIEMVYECRATPDRRTLG